MYQTQKSRLKADYWYREGYIEGAFRSQHGCSGRSRYGLPQQSGSTLSGLIGAIQ
jgi:hypothetical protein